MVLHLTWSKCIITGAWSSGLSVRLVAVDLDSIPWPSQTKRL